VTKDRGGGGGFAACALRSACVSAGISKPVPGRKLKPHRTGIGGLGNYLVLVRTFFFSLGARVGGIVVLNCKNE
jgi:hypothetical protein